jgi:CheY-like chemotaxis protein
MGRISQLLIIDDDLASRQLMVEVAREVLDPKTVITCSSAFKALTHIREHCLPTVAKPNLFCPELIFVDISMPVIDGYEFLAELHKMEGLRHKNTSVLFVSTHPYSQEKDKARLFPVLGYLEKPITSENLRYALKNIIPKSSNAR